LRTRHETAPVAAVCLWLLLPPKRLTLIPQMSLVAAEKQPRP
jgi:hypothetical protein